MLITEAPVNVEDEFAHRRKRYLITMIVRALCVVGAASTYQISGWIACGFVVGAMVLPWCAVLIANDRPPKKELQFRRFVPGAGGGARELTAGPAPRPASEAGADGQDRPPRVIDL